MHSKMGLRRFVAVAAITIGGVVGSLGISSGSVSAATATPATHATTMSPSDWCRWHDCDRGGRGDCWRWGDCRGDRGGDCRWRRCWR
jgi:hypothetical protein